MMQHCVQTARAAGVFAQFHVLTDRPIAGCQCYDAYHCDKADGLFKLHYLKVGMTELNFDYFIWLDADTVFIRNPIDVLEPLGHSPIHVPLEVGLSALTLDREYKGVSCFKLRDLLREEGISNCPYLSRSAFWIIHQEAIRQVYELALGFWHRAKETGLLLTVDHALGYAAQMLCANPESHRLEYASHIWISDDEGQFKDSIPDGAAWTWHHPLLSEGTQVRPAIVHLPQSKQVLINKAVMGLGANTP